MADLDCESDRDRVRACVCERVCEGEPVSDGVWERDCEAVPVREAVEVSLADCVGVDTELGLNVAVVVCV